MKDPFAALPRNERRYHLNKEAKARVSGLWGEWEVFALKPDRNGMFWSRTFTAAHRNAVFCVLDRTLVGGVRHLMITSLSGIRPSFHEMQRIKNEIAGPDATAVEVYPPHRELFDGADAYHLWVLPDPLPFKISDPARRS